jgi:putative ABC transport system substrate-binding protein
MARDGPSDLDSGAARHVGRRELIALLGGAAAAAWPTAVRAQSATPRIGILMGYAEDDPEAQARLAAFSRRLTALGWSDGRSLRVDTRWTAGSVDLATRYAAELLALRPALIVSNTTPVTAAVRRATSTVPVVFVVVSDPVGGGFVESLARPGGNMTGFVNLEPSMVEKWLELLKQIAPRVARVAVMFNPQTAPYAEYYLKPLQAAAPSFAVQPFAAPVASRADIEQAIVALGREAGGGLIVMTDSFMTVHRKNIVDLTAQHRVPAISFVNSMAREGGLISYGVDIADLFDRAAVYVDRILRGAKPPDLPVRAPTKFELIVNLKTAKALGLTVPPMLLARADEVIE